MSAFSSVIDFCHVERSETSLAVSLNILHGNDLRFFASLRMTEEDPWKSFAYSGTPGKSVTFAGLIRHSVESICILAGQ